jgi:general secretion pathway protein I
MKRGFTLLEVLMAIAILGLGLSVLLGAQTGLFASANRAEKISIATGLARCKMSELELELLQKGFPLLDQEAEGECCMGELQEGYQCRWKIQTVELPEPPSAELEMDGGLDTEGTGPLGALMTLQQQGSTALGEKPDIGALATELTSSMSGGDGLASMVMGFVYPTLKPLLEASIRKVIVTVYWREGVRERTLDVTQFITNPQQGLPPDADGGVSTGGGLGSPGTGAGTGSGTGTGAGNPPGGSGLLGGFRFGSTGSSRGTPAAMGTESTP